MGKFYLLFHSSFLGYPVRDPDHDDTIANFLQHGFTLEANPLVGNGCVSKGRTEKIQLDNNFDSAYDLNILNPNFDPAISSPSVDSRLCRQFFPGLNTKQTRMYWC